MAVSIRNTTTPVASATINKPTGTADGDCLLALGYPTTGSITTPSGWTLQTNFFLSGSANVHVFWKVASGEPSSYTFTNAFVMGMTCFQGSDTGTPFNAIASTNGTGFSALTIPSVTTTLDGCLVTRHLMSVSIGNTWTESAGTEKFDASGYAMVDSGVVSPAGASGTITGAQTSNTSYAFASISIAPSQGLPQLRTTSTTAVMRASYW